MLLFAFCVFTPDVGFGVDWFCCFGFGICVSYWIACCGLVWFACLGFVRVIWFVYVWLCWVDGWLEFSCGLVRLVLVGICDGGWLLWFYWFVCLILFVFWVFIWVGLVFNSFSWRFCVIIVCWINLLLALFVDLFVNLISACYLFVGLFCLFRWFALRVLFVVCCDLLFVFGYFWVLVGVFVWFGLVVLVCCVLTLLIELVVVLLYFCLAVCDGLFSCFVVWVC